MKSDIKKLFFFFCIFLSCFAALAQQNSLSNTDGKPVPTNEFSVSAQIRPRFEYRNGAYRPLEQGEPPAILVNNRARLTIDYANEDKLKLRISAQSVNVWGQDAQVQPIAPTSGTFSVFEAYGDVRLSETFRTKIGRQMISLDDDRIFGTLDWHPAGRSHDALNFSWKNGKAAELQSYFAFNQNYKDVGKNVNNPAGQYFTPTDAQPYQHMEMLYGKFSVAENSYVSVLVNNLGFKKDAIADNGTVMSGKVHNMQTFGLNWFGNYGQWKSQFSGYYQTGKNIVGKQKSAYMLSGLVGCQISQPVGITAGADFLTGDDFGKDSKDKTNYFDPLYGTHHKFYGTMDYFYVAGANTTGLLDAYLNFAVKTGAKTNFSLAGHWFNTAGKVYNAAGEKISKNLGGEADLTFNHQIHSMIGLTGGYSVYFHAPTLRVIKNTPDARRHQDWFWLSININPKIFVARF